MRGTSSSVRGLEAFFVPCKYEWKKDDFKGLNPSDNLWLNQGENKILCEDFMKYPILKIDTKTTRLLFNAVKLDPITSPCKRHKLLPLTLSVFAHYFSLAFLLWKLSLWIFWRNEMWVLLRKMLLLIHNTHYTYCNMISSIYL